MMVHLAEYLESMRLASDALISQRIRVLANQTREGSLLFMETSAVTCSERYTKKPEDITHIPANLVDAKNYAALAHAVEKGEINFYMTDLAYKELSRGISFSRRMAR